MRGTTVCPHCNTRFKITKAQLEAHHGMVRCGHCLQAFDTGPHFTPDQLDLQLELPILDKPLPARDSKMAVLRPMTLAEQVAFIKDDANEYDFKRRAWPWAVASLLLLLTLIAQTAYFFRVDLAARVPGLKPALVEYCRMLKCTVPLPQHTDLISIESSELEADPANVSQISLNALLLNRAPYAQAFPDLELTLNDIQDKPIARRTFTPANYLPQTENEATGLLPNHDISVKLHLNTGSLKPSGYRLVLLNSGS
ncbi:MAG TPA: zinc-ribbon and DUF3426 domain-containing protein [Gallionella sp.]|nr:zinc-ribbon and DUF3426 domain-containing protein [Gallionella sp.]